MLLKLKKTGAKINVSFSMCLLQLHPAKEREELMYCSKLFNPYRTNVENRVSS